ncbi:MAG TPA: polyphosphate kinase 1 [bacterium]
MKVKLRNKELSWMSFNARVLQEASDPAVPLIERLRFLGIFSSNLDEFFRVRVATLKRIARLGRPAKKILGQDPQKILARIQDIVLEQQAKFEQFYQQILAELGKENIFIIDELQLSAEQGEFVKNYFHREVRPKLIPIMLEPNVKFPVLKDKSIYLAVVLARKNDPQKAKYALIEIPSDVLPRFRILPDIGNKRYIILLDDVIRYGLEDIFSVFNFYIGGAYTLKLTRDAELDLSEDLSESYIRKVSKSVKQRKAGNPVRLVYDAQMPQEFLAFLTRQLGINKDDTVIPGSKYHNFKDFMNFPEVGPKRLRYEPQIFLPHENIDPRKSLFTTIRDRDILLHFPYHSFDHFIDLLREASIDPKVAAIKITLYRVAKNSSVVNALINAVKNGKSVTVVVELQARFDEETNIYIANNMQEEGVRVIYGVPGLKVHSKLCLITRREKNKAVHYACIGTGNLNEVTAKLYGDHFLFTADKRLTKEVHRIFEFFANNYKVSSFKHLIVSPYNMRQKFVRMIRNEIKNAQAGKEASIFLKMNNLADPFIIQELYKASAAGVKIKLIVRGMFSLVTGMPGLSANIEAISIVDKFLEHTRIYSFSNAGEPKYFISSGDWMTRNFDGRVEVTCPIYDKSIQAELQTFLDIQWQDNVKARSLDRGLSNGFSTRPPRSKMRSQFKLYDFLKDTKAFLNVS